MKQFNFFNYFTKEEFYLTQAYGVNPSYYSKFNLLWHEGLDLGDLNDPQAWVRAVHDGIVIQDHDNHAGRNYGNTVVVWDDKQLCATYYCHLKENYVKKGQRVNAGDRLGLMGATGNVTGKHLHFNFVITDANGNRKYNTKAQNWGYLDPQHPLDPNAPKKMSGVEDYQVKWLNPVTNSEDTTMIQVENKVYEHLVNGATVRKEVAEYLVITDPDNASTDAFKKVLSGKDGYINQLQREKDEIQIRINNKEEELVRVNAQLTELLKNSQELTKELEEAQKVPIQLRRDIQALQDEKRALDDAWGKKFGNLTIEKQGIQTKLDQANEKIITLVNQQSKLYTVKEAVTILLNTIVSGRW